MDAPARSPARTTRTPRRRAAACCRPPRSARTGAAQCSPSSPPSSAASRVGAAHRRTLPGLPGPPRRRAQGAGARCVRTDRVRRGGGLRLRTPETTAESPPHHAAPAKRTQIKSLERILKCSERSRTPRKAPSDRCSKAAPQKRPHGKYNFCRCVLGSSNVFSANWYLTFFISCDLRTHRWTRHDRRTPLLEAAKDEEPTGGD